MIEFRKALHSVVFAFAASGLAACGGSSDDASGSGTLSMGLTDATADNVSEVRLTISQVAVKPVDGDPVRVDYANEPLIIDNVLDLQGSHFAEIMGDTEVPAGDYSWVRLYLVGGAPDSRVTTDAGEQYDLFVPGQQRSGNNDRFIQLVSGFEVPVNGDVDFTLDLDLRRALTRPANADHYLLRPALRIVNNAKVGTIRGTVSDPLVNGESCTNDLAAEDGNAVYLYEGSDAATGDVYIDDQGEAVTADNPLTVANVTQNPDTGAWEYEIGFIPNGDYTIAFTCQSLDDGESADDSIDFADTANIPVSQGSTTTQDFPSDNVTPSTSEEG